MSLVAVKVVLEEERRGAAGGITTTYSGCYSATISDLIANWGGNGSVAARVWGCDITDCNATDGFAATMSWFIISG